MSIGIVLIGLGTTPDDLTISARTLLEEAQEVVLLDTLPPGYHAFVAKDSFRMLEAMIEEQGLEESTDDVSANLLLKLGIRPRVS